MDDLFYKAPEFTHYDSLLRRIKIMREDLEVKSRGEKDYLIDLIKDRALRKDEYLQRLGNINKFLISYYASNKVKVISKISRLFPKRRKRKKDKKENKWGDSL